LNVSVGICVHNEETNVANVVGAVLREPIVEELIVVASGCTDSTLERLQPFQHDTRLQIVIEPTRTGKTPAFNIVLATYHGDFLVSLPGDVVPTTGSITRLVESFHGDIGIVGGLPIPTNGWETIMDRVALLAWTYHNEALLRLERANRLGHVSGEIFAMRRGVVDHLPPETVLDDAGLALGALRAGYRISIAPQATVLIHGARTAKDFMIQRRRNLVGHRQLNGQRHGHGGPPSLTFSNGLADSIRALLSVLRTSPRLMVAVAPAIVLETASRLLAWVDWQKGKTHLIWEIAHSTKGSH
jgi:glycosyltransferase involved in cell wall biosynthesis